MSSHRTSLMQKVFSNPLFRTFLIFSIFRAFYGAGILVVTWFLATSGETPWWSSIIFLLFSMVLSRMLFRRIKLRWPHLFETSQDPVV
ncbi:MAG: hypothetical protein CMA96_03985 [Euryarchaeota archaeon]|nr:hypothetical protein [Euryarchaeota archaeon]HIH56470.1 hypothetical protein [Candidatus Thalassarchaeum sp.]